LREALEASDWNIAETARWLDLARAHLDSLLEVSGIAAAWQC
jgi:transcriptional regulator with GAF, ATPase, and Fis domain